MEINKQCVVALTWTLEDTLGEDLDVLQTSPTFFKTITQSIDSIELSRFLDNLTTFRKISIIGQFKIQPIESKNMIFVKIYATMAVIRLTLGLSHDTN